MDARLEVHAPLDPELALEVIGKGVTSLRKEPGDYLARYVARIQGIAANPAVGAARAAMIRSAEERFKECAPGIQFSARLETARIDGIACRKFVRMDVRGMTPANRATLMTLLGRLSPKVDEFPLGGASSEAGLLDWRPEAGPLRDP